MRFHSFIVLILTKNNNSQQILLLKKTSTYCKGIASKQKKGLMPDSEEGLDIYLAQKGEILCQSMSWGRGWETGVYVPSTLHWLQEREEEWQGVELTGAGFDRWG